MPIVILLVLFNMTWISFLDGEPILRSFAELEQINCRENFWTNLLAINNFISSKDPVIFAKQNDFFNFIFFEDMYNSKPFFIVYSAHMVFGS